jgi:hypothetical protein
MTRALITKTYNGTHVLTFREDGYFNMTQAAKVFGKTLENFVRLPSTREYCEALSNTLEITGLELIQVIPGNRYVADRGTWAHPKLASFFARWLDVKFAAWCDTVIHDILHGYAEVVTKPEASEVTNAPASLLEAATLWLEGLERAEAAKNKITKTALN